jgi:beta-xylosidase
VFERIERKVWQPDNVITTGKFYRMAGRNEREQGHWKQAHDYFCLADTINPRAGVKTLMAEMLAKL